MSYTYNNRTFVRRPISYVQARRDRKAACTRIGIVRGLYRGGWVDFPRGIVIVVTLVPVQVASVKSLQ